MNVRTIYLLLIMFCLLPFCWANISNNANAQLGDNGGYTQQIISTNDTTNFSIDNFSLLKIFTITSDNLTQLYYNIKSILPNVQIGFSTSSKSKHLPHYTFSNNIISNHTANLAINTELNNIFLGFAINHEFYKRNKLTDENLSSKNFLEWRLRIGYNF